MTTLKEIITKTFITKTFVVSLGTASSFVASSILMTPSTALAKTCYVAVQAKAEHFDKQKLANVSLSLISQFVKKVQPIPAGGASADACFYEVFASQEESGVLVALRGEGLNGYASDSGGFQPAMLQALHRALPDKRKDICQTYPNDTPACQKDKTPDNNNNNDNDRIGIRLSFGKAPKAQTNEDLTTLLQQAQQQDQANRQLTQIKKEWQLWQQQMQANFDKIQQMQQGNIATKLKIQTWQQFKESYQANNPFSTQDESLRQQADEQLTHWQSQPQEAENTAITQEQIAQQTALPPPPPPNASNEDPQAVKLYKRYLLAKKKNLNDRAESAKQTLIKDYPQSGYARNFVINPVQQDLQTRINNQNPIRYQLSDNKKRINFESERDNALWNKLDSLAEHHAQHPHVVALFALAIQLDLMAAEQNFQQGYPDRMQDNWELASSWGKRFSQSEKNLQARQLKLANLRKLIREQKLDEATDFLLDWEIEGDDPQFFQIAQIELYIAQGHFKQAKQSIQELEKAGTDPTTIAKLQQKILFLPNWDKTFGGNMRDKAHSIIQTADGGLAIAGVTSKDSSYNDIWVLKLDKSGNLLWDKTFGGSNEDKAYSITQTADGGLAIVGYTKSKGAGFSDVWVLKLDKSGRLLWDKTFGGSNSDWAYSITQTADGGLAIAGYTESKGAGKSDVWVLKLDKSGNLLWDKTFGGSDWDSAYSIAQTADGGLTIAGYTGSKGAGQEDVWVLKLDGSGNLLWDKTFGGSNEDKAHSIIQTTDGGFAIAGYTYGKGAGDWDFWVLKLDGSGNLLWDKTFGGSNEDKAHSIIQTTDGGFAIAGYTGSKGAGFRDVWVLKLDKSGNLIWDKTFGGRSSDVARSIIQTADGGLAVAGSTESKGAGKSDVWVLKLKADGSLKE